MFSFGIDVYKREHPIPLAKRLIKNASNSSQSLCGRDLYICMGWHLVIKSL